MMQTIEKYKLRAKGSVFWGPFLKKILPLFVDVSPKSELRLGLHLRFFLETGLWIGINEDIDQLLRTCSQCQKYQYPQQREPLQRHEIPPRPWHTIATDLFMWEQNTYLIMVDLFSKYPIVRRISTTSSKSAINQMRGAFEEHGIIEKLISDNGQLFTSNEFKQ